MQLVKWYLGTQSGSQETSEGELEIGVVWVQYWSITLFLRVQILECSCTWESFFNFFETLGMDLVANCHWLSFLSTDKLELCDFNVSQILSPREYVELAFEHPRKFNLYG